VASVVSRRPNNVYNRSVRYLVTARVKAGRRAALDKAIDAGTLGAGSVAGGEYQDNMGSARELPDGRVKWVETCFCATPLAEERPYWEAYFDILSVKDAHARSRCRDANGSEPWACCDCDCTDRLEQRLSGQGKPFQSP
jgi:hypothetical protein